MDFINGQASRGFTIFNHHIYGCNKVSAAIAIFLLYLTGVIGRPAFALPETNTIKFRNCTLTLPGTTQTAPARCGWLKVPENPRQPDGKKIRLHVALAPAVSRDPKPDPLFFFAGGPGQAASEAYVMLQPILEKFRRDRDIVLIDQRGTGQSNPLKCPVDESDTLETTINLDVIRARTRACLKQLKGDPRFYTTTIGMQDYDKVRRAMGYDKINLFGVSYGTRAAQVYLRLFPKHVRSVILDSVVPMELILGTEHARMLDRSVAATFADCDRDKQCHRLFGDVETGLHDLLRHLREQPRKILFTNPMTGKQESLTVTADVLAVAIRFLSYNSESQAVLPLLVHEAATTGNLERLTSQAMLIMGSLSAQISHGMELSVICNEDYPFMSGTQNDAGTILGNNFLAAIKAECKIWPRGEPVPDFHKPVTSDVPVLLLTGTRDPVTPPQYARETAAHFPNSLVLTGNGLGHGAITNYCMREIAVQFVEQGSVRNLNTKCVADIKPAPFFTSILGPSP